MDAATGSLLWSMLEKVGLAFLLVYALAQTGYFRQILSRRLHARNQAVLIVFFGGLAILGTYTGAALPSGAIINIRDMSPMVAGLVGGPVVGLGAGLIGGIHRYTVGGLTATPCAITTILAGLLGGLVYLWVGKNVIAAHWAGLYAVVMMALEMGLILLLVQPFSSAMATVQIIALPMIVANAVGTGVIVFMVRNVAREVNPDALAGRPEREGAFASPGR
ncbi:MAG: hypothetical protein HY675_27410 [Chloroflexi bacterium]|nr:hypothetical protein [Chloroflexota bacterium]